MPPFPSLTWYFLRREAKKWRYSVIYLISEIILALIVAFSAVKPIYGPTAFEVRFGVFSTVRATITFMTVPMHINALQMRFFLESAKRKAGRLALSYIALLASLLPLRLFGALLITAIVYPIVQLREGTGHILVFILIIWLQTLTGITLSLLISATFPEPSLADIAAALLLPINIIFAGTLLPPPRITRGLRWLHYSAYAYFATIAYNQNEYAGRIVPGAPGYPNVQGVIFLRAKGLDEMGLWGAIGGLTLHSLVYMAASIAILEGRSLMQMNRNRPSDHCSLINVQVPETILPRDR